MRTILRHSAIAVIIGCLTTVTADEAPAQRTAATTSNGPGWEPPRVRLDGMNATAAEKAYARAKLEEIERIIVQVPEIGNPEFRIREDFSGFYASAPKPNTILQYQLQVVVGTSQEAMSSLCVIFEAVVNKTPVGSSDADELGRGVNFEELYGTQRPGASVVWRKLLPPRDPSFEYVVFAPDDDPPWTPLTREEFRRWQIFTAEGKNGEKKLAYRQSLEKTMYDRFMDEAPRRKKEREELAAGLKALKPAAEVDSLIREMENGEREAAANMKADDAEERAKNKALLNAPWIGDLLRADISAMTPEERKQTAYVRAAIRNDLGYDLGTATDTPFVVRVSRNNMDHWRARRSRTEVRSIELRFHGLCTKEPPPPAAHRALWALYNKIDWAAIKRLVDAPR